jgi:hypothetical protein
MGSWVIAVVIIAMGASCLSFRVGKRLRGAAIASFVIIFFCYLMGAAEVMFADPSRMCEPTAPIPTVDRYEEAFFPPRAVCHWPDGHTDDLVSSWVNPLMFTALGVAAVCLVALVVSRYRKGLLH